MPPRRTADSALTDRERERNHAQRTALYKRVLEEIETAAALLRVSEAEFCRRAGYSETYLTHLRGAVRKGRHGPTLRLLADIEEAWGVKFDITVLPEPKP